MLLIGAAVSYSMADSCNIFLLTPPSVSSNGNDHNEQEDRPNASPVQGSNPFLLTPPSEHSSVAAASKLSPHEGDSSKRSPHNRNGDGSFDDEPADEADAKAQPQVLANSSRRGTHTRTSSMRRRKKWIPWVKDHMASIRDLITTNACLPNCSGCDVGSFATLQLAQLCATESFGEAAVAGVLCTCSAALMQVHRAALISVIALATEDWYNIKRNHTATDDWFTLARSGRMCDPSGAIMAITYKIGDHRVCLDTWAAMRGVPPSTATTIDRKVRAGVVTWNANSTKLVALAQRSERAALVRLATGWWYIRLGYYEWVVHSLTIQYPRDLCFKAMYADEFVPEMRLRGHDWRIPSPSRRDARPRGKAPLEDGQRGVDGDVSTAGDEVVSDEGGLCDHCESDIDELFQVEDLAKGSIATWYQGRKNALLELAKEKVGEDSGPFKFLSRANHSAYKECGRCQILRLELAEAIANKATFEVVSAKKAALVAHLQSMYKQRATLDRLIETSAYVGYLMENSDKCGDECMDLPASQRIMDVNASLYQYRIALQANVYAGKLFHLSLVLPNLVTGANFGLTTELCGLVRMIQLGEVTQETRSFLRGVDGGSENVNHASLGMNCTLVGPKTRRFDHVRQNRLPPGHSHHYLTDGLFAVIEGWMTGPGFAGCSTLAELMTYLIKRFAASSAYSDKAVEISVLVVNFSFTKWFQGHLHMNKVSKIGDPLVWAHTWIEQERRVLTQYKYLISDSATFEKDEWGPWVEKSVKVNDPTTGELVVKTVLRSDPQGVDIMASWPEFGDFPGVKRL